MLDWEESVFVGLKKLYNRAFKRPEENRRAAVRATLASRRQRLLLLAQMLAGRPLSLFETNDLRLFDGDRIFLPCEFSIAGTQDANESLYVLKVVAAALAIRGDWRMNGLSLDEHIRQCSDEFPGIAEVIECTQAALPEGVELWQILGVLPAKEKAASAASQVPSDMTAGETKEVTSELQGKGQADVNVIAADSLDDPGAEMPDHVFEKVEALEEYQGTPRKTDDDDSLEDHGEALRELEMRQLLRTPERPRSIYRADVILDGLGLEVGDDSRNAGIPYPEWDYRTRSYRKDWCFVQPGRSVTTVAGWGARIAAKHGALIRRLRRQFAALRSDMERLRRQPNGPEFDIDAIVNAEVERRTGHTPSEAIYTDKRRDTHDIAALILLDLSYSTDAWLDGHRVLDVITETILCAGEVLHDSIEKVAIAGFTSHTRRACGFSLLKDFREPWLPARDRLGAAQAQGYTRIGPALRHAQELLENEHAQRKIVLLFTDGKPCDYDRYEGEHGNRDVKKAIETGRLHGIETHAFAIEKQAAAQFPAMFTRTGYDIIPNPSRLTDAICRVFARLLREQ
jgi:nitric oxide reductase NorD protein